MGDECVIDASVIAAALFPEEFTPRAREFLLRTPRLIAPDLIHGEIASVAAKKVWRGEISQAVGAKALVALSSLVATVPLDVLAPRAFALAAQHRLSAYDALYLALSEARGIPLFTFDGALVRKAVAAGLAGLVGGSEPDLT